MPAEEPGEFALRDQVIHGYHRAYRMAGRGPAVLFIHGIGDYSVAAYACAMRDLLATLDVERVSVVGHSLGGGVAMQFAYQFPQLCERLVLVSSGGVGPEVHPLLRLAAAPGAELLLPLLGLTPVPLLLRGLDRLLRRVDGFGMGTDLDYVIGKYVRLAESTSRQAFLRTLRSVVDWRGQVVTMLDRGYLTEGMPTMLVWGTRDRVVPSPHALIAYEALPSSRLEIFEGAGHFPHHTEPHRFLAILREFLTETHPATHDSDNWRKLLRAGRRSRPAEEQQVPSSGT